MSERDTTNEPKPPTDLVGGMVELVNAALGIGAALSKTAATVTAGGRPVGEPPKGAAPISVMIHYSLAVVTNVVSLVTDTLKGTAAGAAGLATRPATAAASGPLVRPGASLRVPLSIENPSDRPMSGLTPLVRAVRRDGKDASPDIPASAVRFAPAAINVAPKDFEKLTVFVTVPENAAPGRYEVTLALGPNEADLPLVFDVAEGEGAAG
jgi:hypothetical protein